MTSIANVNLNETYPIVLQIKSATPQVFEFLSDEGTVTIDLSNTSVEITNSRGGIVLARTSDGIFADQKRYLVGYTWNTTEFSPQEYYTFSFRVAIKYVTEWDSSVDPRTPISTQEFILESSLTKSLQAVNIFSSV